MKKIIVLICFIAIAFKAKAQINVEIKGNTVMTNPVPNTNGGYSFGDYAVIDETSNTSVGQYVEVKREGITKRIYIASVLSFKVDGVSAPISYTSIRDSLRNHVTFGSSSSAGGSSVTLAPNAATASNQQLQLDKFKTYTNLPLKVDSGIGTRQVPFTAQFGANATTVTAYTTDNNTITTTNCIKIIIENVSTTSNANVVYDGKTYPIGFIGSGQNTTRTFEAIFEIASQKYTPFATMVINANASNILLTKTFGQ